MNSRILKYLILVALGLLIVAISSFWFSGPSFREKDVVFEIEGPTQVSSGEEVVFKLKYSNETRSTLHDLEFAFFYPEGATVFEDGKLIEGYSEDFSIEELGSGESGEKEFRAFLIGEKGNIKITKAILSFKSGSLSSTFEKNTSLSTTVVSAPITLTLVAPPSTVSGATVEYILDYRNTTDEDAHDLMIEFDYPDGFIARQFDPNPDTGNKSWAIQSLKKGTGGRIRVSGVLNGKEEENKVVSVNLKRKINGEYVDYQKTSAATVISNPILGVEVLANGSNNYVASLGDTINYTIKYANSSNINFFGMNLTVKLEGDTFDFSTLNTRGGFYDDSTKTITWNSSIISDFNNFVVGMKGQLDFNISLKSAFPSAIPGSSQDKFVKVTAKLGTANVPSGFDGDEVFVSSSLVTKITTQPAFNQSAYYNDPSFGSTGTFPLRVGEETYFTIHWQLSNPGNDIDNVQIVAKVPPGIEWVNAVVANNNLPTPVYNTNASNITWSFPKLPYGTGIFSEKYQTSFRIKVRPTSQQKGETVKLMESAQFTGTDNFTKQNIVINRKDISSNELGDRPREGTVQ